MGEFLWANNFLKKKSKEAQKVEIIEKAEIFHGLSKKELFEVEKTTYTRIYHPGEYIFRKSNPGDGMYIIMDGSVQIVDERSDGNEEITLVTLNNGDFFGEISLLDESPRSASAKCNKKTEAMSFFRADLLDILNRRPMIGSKIILNLARVLGERLRATNNRLNELESKLNEIDAATEKNDE